METKKFKTKKAKRFFTRVKKNSNFLREKPRNKSGQQSSHKPNKKSRRVKLKQHRIKINKTKFENRKKKLEEKRMLITEKKKERFKQLFKNEKLEAYDGQIEIAVLMEKISNIDQDIIAQIMRININYIEKKKANANLKLTQLTERVNAIYHTNSDKQLINEAIRGLFQVIDINHSSITSDFKSFLEYIRENDKITLHTLIDDIKNIDLNKIDGFKIESIEIFLEKISLLEKLLDEIEYAVNDILLDATSIHYDFYQYLSDLFDSDGYIHNYPIDDSDNI